MVKVASIMSSPGVSWLVPSCHFQSIFTLWDIPDLGYVTSTCPSFLLEPWTGHLMYVSVSRNATSTNKLIYAESGIYLACIGIRVLLQLLSQTSTFSLVEQGPLPTTICMQFRLTWPVRIHSNDILEHRDCLWRDRHLLRSGLLQQKPRLVGQRSPWRWLWRGRVFAFADTRLWIILNAWANEPCHVTLALSLDSNVFARFRNTVFLYRISLDSILVSRKQADLVSHQT